MIDNHAMPGLTGFNEAPAEMAERELLTCCGSARWARQVAAGRPYPDLAALLAAADAVLADLAWPDVEQALAAHPRIGEQIKGKDRESGWSRREQAGMATAGAATRAALAEANREYEQRFGHVFLIFASGRSDTELLAAARARLGNDPAVERGIVRTELAKIVRLRLARLLEANAAPISTHVLDTVRGEPAAGVPVRLESDGGRVVAEGVTDADGRLRDWAPADAWGAGGYRLVFDVGPYLGDDAFFAEITVAFRVRDPDRHHHVPLLLSRYGYTTYRGS